MKKLKLLIFIFCISWSITMVYFGIQTYWSFEQEDMARLRYFAETLFDDMEQKLSLIVNEEENRTVDEYNYYYSPSSADQTKKKFRSPLSYASQQPYILGYIQNNPDGSFQTPLVEKGKNVSLEQKFIFDRLMTVNKIFNQKRSTDILEPLPVKPLSEKKQTQAPGFADQYLRRSQAKNKKDYLGQKQKRVEKITVNQALNIAQQKENIEPEARKPVKTESNWLAGKADEYMAESSRESEYNKYDRILEQSLKSGKLEAELDPMQSVFIDELKIFIFRRIVIHNQIFRQGFVIDAKEFLEYLAREYFIPQPMSKFTYLELQVIHKKTDISKVTAGTFVKNPKFSLNRTFPRPFSFLQANIVCEQIPRSSGRNTLNIMMTGLAFIMLISLFAIYRSAHTIAELSERKSQFVSSVTHELKTPLTNIRMYIEMLEQGIARTPEREQEYFKILGSESARLSRLINNILEFSRLEKKQLKLNMNQGMFTEVIHKVQDIMKENLFKAGFVLHIKADKVQPFFYDQEVMIQVIINLLENSMKFGRDCDKREITLQVSEDDKWINISVSDTGPGIPRHALKKVFDDFFRVDNTLIQNTRGTGIGLAFVKKVINTMKGRVSAENNQGPGCTIILSLPKTKS